MRNRSERVRKYLSLLGILLAHPSNMPVEVPVSDESCQHLLQRPRDVFVGQVLELIDTLAEQGRSYQIAHAQGRGQHFGEGPQIGHAPGVIKTGEGWEWRGIEAKLAVIIVFYDEALVGLCPGEQRQAASNGKPG